MMPAVISAFTKCEVQSFVISYNNSRKKLTIIILRIAKGMQPGDNQNQV